MSQVVNNPTQITLPADLVERLQNDAKRMGLSLPAYIGFLEQVRTQHLDSQAQDAARFVFSKHAESLRKLAL